MHAIEITDGDDAAFELVGNILIVAENSHRGRQAFRDGGMTVASPSMTTVVPDPADAIEEDAALFRNDVAHRAHGVVTVSPIRTGALKRTFNPRKIVPGPGHLHAKHGGNVAGRKHAMRDAPLERRGRCAKASSKCTGLVSPLTSPNSCDVVFASPSW